MSGLQTPYFHDERFLDRYEAEPMGDLSDYLIVADPDIRRQVDEQPAETPSQALGLWAERFGFTGYRFVCARDRHEPFRHFEVILASGQLRYMVNVLPIHDQQDSD
jgi:hypothetical protein